MPDSGTNAGADSGADSSADSGADSGADSSANSGADSLTNAESDSLTNAESDSGADARADSESNSRADVARVVPTGIGVCASQDWTQPSARQTGGSVCGCYSLPWVRRPHKLESQGGGTFQECR
jgi:hypothetical protein